MATPPNERTKAYRLRKRASGLARVSFYLSAEARKVLATLRARHPDQTQDELFNALLLGQIASPGHEVGLSPGHDPKDRAELAAMGHRWRREGKSASEIATEFNRKGWTPDRVPKRVGAKVRSDSARGWSLKAVSQLLNRDHPEG